MEGTYNLVHSSLLILRADLEYLDQIKTLRIQPKNLLFFIFLFSKQDSRKAYISLKSSDLYFLGKGDTWLFTLN